MRPCERVASALEPLSIGRAPSVVRAWGAKSARSILTRPTSGPDPTSASAPRGHHRNATARAPSSALSVSKTRPPPSTMGWDPTSGATVALASTAPARHAAIPHFASGCRDRHGNVTRHDEAILLNTQRYSRPSMADTLSAISPAGVSALSATPTAPAPAVPEHRPYRHPEGFPHFPLPPRPGPIPGRPPRDAEVPA